MRLYTYFRSSAAWRVRIALAAKGLTAEAIPVHLRHNEQHAPAFLAANPQGLVPVLDDGGVVIQQSLAICEYLDERYPQPPLLPADAVARAQVRAFVLAIACDVHPLGNLRVLRYLEHTLGLNNEARDAWTRHWIAEGFAALESIPALTPASGFCLGGQLSLADVFLVPQVTNARRVALDLTPYPRLLACEAHLMTLPCFADTQPSRQPDAE